MSDSHEERERPAVNSRALWQLPTGVSRGAWDYVNEPSIATDYDRFHAGHPLLVLDQELIAKHLSDQASHAQGRTKIAIDCGCGTGRSLLPLLRMGWRVLGVDLSHDMLREFRSKAVLESTQEFATIRANMAKLDFLADDFADAFLCMYSSLGMVQGQVNRRSFLRHAARILRKDGKLIVHVHNRGSWLRDPGGIRKTFVDWCRSKRGGSWELGDSVYAYRGLPTMFLHIYSERELRSDLTASGLRIERLYRLNRTSSAVLRGSWLPHLRSGGFIAICKRM